MSAWVRWSFGFFDFILHAFAFRSLARISWISRTGAKPRETIYYNSHGYAYNTDAVFRLNDLTVFSNLKSSTPSERKYHGECKRVFDITMILSG